MMECLIKYYMQNKKNKKSSYPHLIFPPITPIIKLEGLFGLLLCVVCSIIVSSINIGGVIVAMKNRTFMKILVLLMLTLAFTAHSVEIGRAHV